jgi:hypothetical protein
VALGRRVRAVPSRGSLFRSTVPTLIGLILFAVLSAAAFAWGFAGHDMVTHHAVGLVSGDLGAFLNANMATLVAFSAEPDVLSEGNASEAPNHFFDMDAFDKPPFAAIPSTEAAFVGKFGKDATKEGRLPWAAADAYKALVDSMRAKDYEGVLRNAGHLSHYVADSTMPLHATKNYKGQATGNVILVDRTPDRHVHVRFEVGMIEANRDEIDSLIGKRAGGVHRIADPAAETINNLRNSYSLVDSVLTADRQILKPGEAVTPQYFKELYERVGGIAVSQMAFAAGEVASFWESAYEDAGRPSIPALEVKLKTAPLSRDIVLNKDKPK